MLVKLLFILNYQYGNFSFDLARLHGRHSKRCRCKRYRFKWEIIRATRSSGKNTKISWISFSKLNIFLPFLFNVNTHHIIHFSLLQPKAFIHNLNYCYQIPKIEKEAALKFARLAMRCCDTKRKKRPSMSITLDELLKVKDAINYKKSYGTVTGPTTGKFMVEIIWLFWRTSWSKINFLKLFVLICKVANG